MIRASLGSSTFCSKLVATETFLTCLQFPVPPNLSDKAITFFFLLFLLLFAQYLGDAVRFSYLL
jgi:hypothetical protein